MIEGIIEIVIVIISEIVKRLFKWLLILARSLSTTF